MKINSRTRFWKAGGQMRAPSSPYSAPTILSPKQAQTKWPPPTQDRLLCYRTLADEDICHWRRWIHRLQFYSACSVVKAGIQDRQLRQADLRGKPRKRGVGCR